MNEIWKPAIHIDENGVLTDLSDKIWVSNLNRYKILNYYKTGKDKIKEKKNDGKYKNISVYNDGKISHYSFHRVVLSTFCPESDNYECINHKDENPSNNNLENIEWCTFKYNNNYGTKNERCSKSHIGLKHTEEEKRKIAQNNSITHIKPVLQYDLEGNFIKEWESFTKIFKELGFNVSNISACCYGKLKSAYGYIWKLKEQALVDFFVLFDELLTEDENKFTMDIKEIFPEE